MNRLTVKDYLDAYVLENDCPYENSTLLKYINLMESNLDIIKSYTVKYYARVLNAFQYALPTGVTIDDVVSVYVNGKRYKKKDARAYKEIYSYWYEDGKLCIHPACSEADLSYVSEANEITFAASTITTTGDDSTFCIGDTVLVSGATTAANNKYATIIGVAAKVLTFADSTFTAGADAAVVTISRPKIKVVYENKHTTKLIANIATDTLVLDDKWVDLYDYYLRAKIADLQHESSEYTNCMATYNARLAEYEQWYENHRPQKPISGIVPEDNGYSVSNFDTDTE
ncbi:MAG: hypothetical protein ABFD25_03295 [Clostridiaceae bacterium]